MDIIGIIFYTYVSFRMIDSTSLLYRKKYGYRDQKCSVIQVYRLFHTLGSMNQEKTFILGIFAASTAC